MNLRRPRPFARTLLALTLFSLWIGEAGAAQLYSIETLIDQGDPAPGSAGGVFMEPFGYDNWLDSYDVGAPGQFVFVASLAGGNAASAQYQIVDSVISPIRFSGTPAPGGGTFDSFTQISASPNGSIAFVGTVAGVDGVFLSTVAQGDQRLWTIGDIAPGTGGQTFTSFAFPAVNDLGEVAFHATYSGGSGIFLRTGAGTTAIALTSQPSPSGFDYAGFNFNYVQINGAGTVVFTAQDLFGDEMVVRVHDGSAQAIALAGMALPQGSGSIRAPIRFAFLSEAGKIGYAVSTGSCSDSVSVPAGSWSIPYPCVALEWENGMTRIVAQKGQPSAQVGGVVGRVVLAYPNDAGITVLAQRDDGSSPNGIDEIFVEIGGELSTVARSEDLPGMDPGLTPSFGFPIDSIGTIIFQAETLLLLARPVPPPVPALSRTNGTWLALALMTLGSLLYRAEATAAYRKD